MNRTIIIMAKVPRAGNVKTRLQPYLSPEQCRTLAEAFLFDAIHKARNVCDRLIVAFAPADEKDYFADSSFDDLILVEQTGANLGEKMSNAFKFASRQNANANAVLIGTDSPTFPAEFIERTFEFLESKTDAVLGKSADGGFYLIGLRQKIPPRLFDNVEWSSPLVFEQTRRNIERLKFKLNLIPEWFDVDAQDDLRRLRDEIFKDEQMQKIAPRTFQWLLANAETSGKTANDGFVPNNLRAA